MQRLDLSDPAFPAAFDALVDARREAASDVTRGVAAIIRAVRDDGDAALRAFTQKLDGHDLDETGWRIDPAACAAAFDALEPGLRAALELAAARIRAYHDKQRPEDMAFTDAAGVARQIERVERDPEGTRLRGQRARAAAYRYDWDDVADRYSALCERLAGPNGRNYSRPSGRRNHIDVSPTSVIFSRSAASAPAAITVGRHAVADVPSDIAV